MGDKYQIDSDFGDLHDALDDEGELGTSIVDLQGKNPIVDAALADEDDDQGDGSTKDGDKGVKDDPDFEEDDDDLFGELHEELDEEEDDGEDGEQEEEEDDEEEEASDDQKYSKNVKKRIDRERRRANRERQRREALESRLGKVENRLKRQADADAFAERKEEINGKLANLRKKKVEAIEEGNTEDQVELDDQILDLRTELRVEERRVKDAKETTDDLSDVADGIDYSKLAPKAQDWIGEHPEFKTDSKFKRQVIAADSYITSKGSNPNSDKHYARLEEMLQDDFPEYFDEKPKRKKRKRRKPPVTESGRKVKVRTRNRRGRVKITREDKQNMMRFGLDPSDPKHLREYAAVKED